MKYREISSGGAGGDIEARREGEEEEKPGVEKYYVKRRYMSRGSGGISFARRLRSAAHNLMAYKSSFAA